MVSVMQNWTNMNLNNFPLFIFDFFKGEVFQDVTLIHANEASFN